MALQRLCGMDKLPFMMKNDAFVLESEKNELRLGTHNLGNHYALLAPPFEKPAETLPKILARSPGVCMEFKHGTTTLGFIYQGGIILCVDSRSTSGDFIGSQHMKKIIELNDYMLITMAGGAADCTYWDRVLAKECRMYELRYGKRITVISAANMLANTIHQYRDMGLSMGMMLAGFDGDIPKLIYLDSEGYLVDHTEFAVGSGSTLALGLLDTFFKWDMTDREAYDLACRSICNAAHRDAYSGGIVRLYHVTADGWKNINNTDCCDLFEHFEKRKAESRASIAAASESQSETGSELPISIIS